MEAVPHLLPHMTTNTQECEEYDAPAPTVAYRAPVVEYDAPAARAAPSPLVDVPVVQVVQVPQVKAVEKTNEKRTLRISPED